MEIATKPYSAEAAAFESGYKLGMTDFGGLVRVKSSKTRLQGQTWVIYNRSHGSLSVMLTLIMSEVILC